MDIDATEQEQICYIESIINCYASTIEVLRLKKKTQNYNIMIYVSFFMLKIYIIYVLLILGLLSTFIKRTTSSGRKSE